MICFSFFFFNDTATTEIYTLSLHDALPIDLSPTDYDRLSTYGDALSSELANMLHEHAQEQGYLFAGPIRMNFQRVDDLTTGRFRVRSAAVAQVTPAAGQPVGDTAARQAS